jgi:purine nucleosidase
MRSGIPITMLPLDVTHKVLSTRERVARIHAIGNRSGIAVDAMLTFSERFDVNKYGTKGAPLHDPCVMAYLLRPSLFTGRHVNVEVETTSPLTMGMTVADWWHVTGRAPNATYITGADTDGIYALLTERLARLP